MFTPNSTRRVERLLRAAETAFELGRPELVMRVLDKVEAHKLTALERGRLEYLSEIFEDGRSGDPVRVGALVAQAEAGQLAGDTQLAMRLLSRASLR